MEKIWNKRKPGFPQTFDNWIQGLFKVNDNNFIQLNILSSGQLLYQLVRQATEKAVLYILPTGPVTEFAFTRWHIILPSCLDMLTSLCLFRLAHGVCRRVYREERILKFLQQILN